VIHTTLTYEEMKQAVMICMDAKVIPMIVGHPGVSKSALVAEICKKGKLKMIDWRASQMAPEDANGYPKEKDDKLVFVPPADIPLEGDTVPEGMNGWCFFMDEINTASPPVIAALYKFTWDRKVGQKSLHPNVWIVMAGNLENSRAIVNSMGTAMETRIVRLHMTTTDSDGFIKWAEKNGIDHRIISYIRQFGADVLNTFNPDEYTSGTFACNRTWELASRVIKGRKITPITEALLAGAIGPGPASNFIGYLEVYLTLPSINDVMADPDNAEIPTDFSAQLALTGCCVSWATDANFPTLSRYISRFPLELQTITYQHLVASDPTKWVNTPVIRNWMKTNVINIS
jgi:hypothetical protein